MSDRTNADYMLKNAMRRTEKPDPELLSEILLHKEVEHPHAIKWRPKLATALVAATLCVALVTSALAYGDAIWQFVFGSSSVRQVEFDEYNVIFDGGRSVAIGRPSDGPNREIMNRSVPNIELTWEDFHSLGYAEGITESFSSYDDLRQAAPFAVREPSYMPTDWKFTNAELFLYEDGSYSYDVFSFYHKTDEFNPSICIAQFFVGPDAYFDISVAESYEFYIRPGVGFHHTNQIENIMVGDIEAMLIVSARRYQNAVTAQNFRARTIIELVWIQDDTAFHVVLDEAHIPGEFDVEAMVETVINIAESL